MALTPEQRNYYEQKIQAMKADGFFLPSPRSLSGTTRHLIVSYGGTGVDGLFAVKKVFEDSLPAKEINERVRFLAIDTDKDTQKKTETIKRADGTTATVEVDSLNDAQFFQLSGSAAKNIITQPNLDSNVAQWINPQLVQAVKADDKDEYLSGKGASGTRQLGRLMLYPANTANKLAARISTLAKELTDDNTYELRVFIISGISGGTGSGTVVDLTYFIRDAVPAHLKNRVRYGGFILLPPTGKSENADKIQHGNSNGYAALKEINHFMTLKQRDDTYSFTYGNGKTVTSKEPIFNTCYLLDGFSDEMGFANPRVAACRVLAESLLDMITSSQTSDGGMVVQSVDSFMNDMTAFANQMVQNHSVNIAVRDADYVYCALGHSEFAIPANEIKAYVGKQIFDKIYAQFKKCENVGEEDVKSFVANVIKRGVSSKMEVKKSMDAEIQNYFTDRTYGPYFTINLLADVGAEVERIQGMVKLFRPGMVSNESLDWIKSYALKCNNETYAAYTCAMDGLKNLMESQFNAVVSTVKGTRSYSFMPASLGKSENTKHVILYLDGLIDSAAVRNMCDSLLQEMINNKDNWVALIETDLSAKNDAPAAMRKFWNDKLDELVTATMEDMLIKFYSGDPKAHYNPNNHAATKQYLETAAKAIYNDMLGTGAKAQPLVQMSGSGLTASDFIGHTYLMVPECAKHLYDEIKSYAALQGKGVVVCQSLAQDRISCYKQYSALPVFKLHWALEAEKHYEINLAGDVGHGLHMSDTVGGRQWKNFPNLLPRSTWEILEMSHDNDREEALAKKADNLVDEAYALNVVTSDETIAGIQMYHAKILPAQYRPAESLYKKLGNATKGSKFEEEQLAAIDAAAEECAEQLFGMVEWENASNLPGDLSAAGVTFEKRNLHFPNRVNSKAVGDEDIADWDTKLAKMMLRKLPETMSDLEGTMKVMKLLEAKVKKAVEGRTLIKRFAQYLAMDMFKFDETQQNWSYEDANGLATELVYLDNDVMVAAEYYFMFNGFRQDPLKVAKALDEAFTALLPADRATRVAKQTAFREGGANLKQEVLNWRKVKPLNAYKSLIPRLGYDAVAIQNFYLALYAEAEEISQVGYIFADIGEEEEEDFEPVTGKKHTYF